MGIPAALVLRRAPGIALDALFLLLLPLVILVTPLRAGEHSGLETLVMDKSFVSCLAGPYMSYMEDAGGVLTVFDAAGRAASREFAPAGAGILNFGASSSVYWLALTIENVQDGSVSFYLEIAYPLLDEVVLFQPDRETFRTRVSGDHLAFGARDYPHENNVFHITQGTGAATYFFRIRSTTSLSLPVSVYSEKAYSYHASAEGTWKGVFLGILLVMIMYNMFILFSVKEKLYLYYLLYIGSYTYLYLVLSGMGLRYLWNDAIWLNESGFPVFITNVFILMFTRQFLRTWRNIPAVDRFIVGIMLAGGVGAVGVLIFPAVMSAKSIYFTFLCSGVELAAGLASLLRRVKASGLYLVSWGLLAVGSAERGMLALGSFPYNMLTVTFLDAATSLHFVVFSFALAERINSMKKNLEVVVEDRVRAEVEVTRKKEELEATNEELQATIEELEATNEEYERQCDELGQTQVELGKSEEKFSKAFRNSPAIIGISRMSDGRYIEINESFEKILGYPRDDVIGKTSLELGIFVDQADRSRLRDAVAARGAIRDEEALFRTKDGQVRTGVFSVDRIQILGEDCLIVSVNDITERKRAEDALAAEHERLEITLASIGEGVIATSINGTIMVCNGIAAELTGWPARDAMGRGLGEVFTAYYDETRKSPVTILDEAACENGTANSGSILVLVARDGSERKIIESAAPIRDRGGVTIGMVLVFRDVTARVRMEKELMMIEKLKSVNVLAGGIAHDFNNLLAAILGNVNLAKMHTAPGHENYLLLDEAEKACLRATGLTQQLLAFSKGGAPVKKAASMRSLVEETALFVVRGTNALCEFRFADDLWPAYIDGMQVSQVIQNLVINALQAMQGSGTIFISVENRTIGEEDALPLKHGRYVLVEVRDTGTGIDSRNIARIFDPFFTTKADGNGLGLANCYSIVRNHEGHVTVKSALNTGTSFFVYLPASRDSIVHEKKPDRDLSRFTGRVLILEDDPAVQKIVSRMFEFMGMEPTVSESGDRAIEEYGKSIRDGNQFRLVVLDLTVPGGKGGLEVIREMKAINPGLVAVVSSGYSTDPVMSNYREHGFHGVLRKPYTITNIRELLDSLPGT